MDTTFVEYLIYGLLFFGGVLSGVALYHTIGYFSLYSFKYDKETEYILGLERELARLNRFVEKASKHGSCAAFDPGAFGSTPPTFVGCKIHNSDDPGEYCLRCEALEIMEGK